MEHVTRPRRDLHSRTEAAREGGSERVPAGGVPRPPRRSCAPPYKVPISTAEEHRASGQRSRLWEEKGRRRDTATGQEGNRSASGQAGDHAARPRPPGWGHGAAGLQGVCTLGSADVPS